MSIDFWRPIQTQTRLNHIFINFPLKIDKVGAVSKIFESAKHHIIEFKRSLNPRRYD